MTLTTCRLRKAGRNEIFFLFFLLPNKTKGKKGAHDSNGLKIMKKTGLVRRYGRSKAKSKARFSHNLKNYIKYESPNMIC